MKDVTFTLSARRIRRELTWLAVCVVLANALNVYAIVSRKTSWSELVSCLPFVLVIALVFYGVWALVRLATSGLLRLAGKRRDS